MDLFEEDAPSNAPEITVSELSTAIKRTVEGAFSRVAVRGEVGRVTRARTGHLYFDLKDDRNVLACVSWKGQVSRLEHLPQEGLEIVATGKLTTFGPQSRYQLNVDTVRPAGVGALMAMLEKRKAALAAEGLFDPDRKRPIPYLPEIIGVVTSPTGSVIRDILHRLRERFARKVLVWPVAVQGRGSAEQVAAAIRGFNDLPLGGVIPRPDLLIVARGGGALEDLWGFNEEAVVRAAAESRIPLISAVGHETDTTLIDFAADRRAPTPTAAAEMAVPVRLDLLSAVESLGTRQLRATRASVTQRRQRLSDLSRALPRPDELTANGQQRLDLAARGLSSALSGAIQHKGLRLARLGLRRATLANRVAADKDRLARRGERLSPATLGIVERARSELRQTARRLGPSLVGDRIARLADKVEAADRLRLSLGYERTLARGFAIVRAGAQVVTNAADAAAARSLDLQFADGTVQATPKAGKSSRQRSTDTGENDQGSLF